MSQEPNRGSGTDAEVEAVARALYNLTYPQDMQPSDDQWAQAWSSDQFTGTRFRFEREARAAITALDAVRDVQMMDRVMDGEKPIRQPTGDHAP